MDTRERIARLETDIASLRRQNQRVRELVLLLALLALAPWVLAAGSQSAAKPAANTNTVTVDRLNLNGPNGQITLRSIEAVSTAGADNNRPAPALGVFSGTDILAASIVAGRLGSELRLYPANAGGATGKAPGSPSISLRAADGPIADVKVGDVGGVRLSGNAPGRGRVEVVNEDGKTGAELLAAPGGGGSVVIRGPTGAGVAVLETATDGSGQLEVRDAAGRIIQRLP
jgi:hypothetical protein